jgi:hypothetical protein
MAHPFMPMRARRLKKLTKKREDSNQSVTVFNRPIEFNTHHGYSDQNQTRPPKNQTTVKITTDNRFQ